MERERKVVGYAYSIDGEGWSETYPTRQAAIEAGAEDDDWTDIDPDDIRFEVCECVALSSPGSLFDWSEFAELLVERNDGYDSEFANGWDRVARDHSIEINKAIGKAIDKVLDDFKAQPGLWLGDRYATCGVVDGVAKQLESPGD